MQDYYDYDLSYISDDLIYCLKQLLEYNDIEGIFTQKYVIDGHEFWDVNFDDSREAIRILGHEDEDLELHRHLLDSAIASNTEYLLERIERRILDEWSENDTIVLKDIYIDEHCANHTVSCEYFEY